MSRILRVAVMISGAGSNLQALLDARSRENYAIGCVISNRPEAAGLARAAAAGVPAVAIDHAAFPDRPAFEAALDTALSQFAPDLIALAGFMRVLTTDFVSRHEGRLLNVHPSLLPAYRGLHTHARALAAGERWHGTSIHYVTAELDGGPVVLQGRLAVRPEENEETLRARVQAMEHRIYPQALGWVAQGRLRWQDHGPWFDGAPLREPLLFEEMETCPS
jgi:phosphoribosylglycinamide formyltransferase-1